MASPRVGATAVLLKDGTVLVVGGNSAPWPPGVERYDPRTGEWATTGAMITPRMQFAAARLLDGRVLVAGGGGDPGVLASAELYDPDTGSWAATGSLGTARYDASATLLPDGKVLVAGGDIVTRFFNPAVASAELYDPATGSWAATDSMGTVRSVHTATLLGNGKVLVAGGSNDNDTLSYRLASAELYDPVTGAWAATPEMTEARSWHTATLLNDGRVLVIGGSGDEGAARSAELYDPRSGSWTAAGSLSARTGGFTATLLLDGMVLVVGGMDDPPTLASDVVELFDPRAGRWGATAGLLQGRSGHTATLLADGTVLVAGGASQRGSAPGETPSRGPGLLSSAELYQPGR
jgi:hypothetical protein